MSSLRRWRLALYGFSAGLVGYMGLRRYATDLPKRRKGESPVAFRSRAMQPVVQRVEPTAADYREAAAGCYEHEQERAA